MEQDYQQMGGQERLRHHEELCDEGYEWCPECGTALVWDLAAPSTAELGSGRPPVVTGDCPPLTRDELLLTS